MSDYVKCQGRIHEQSHLVCCIEALLTWRGAIGEVLNLSLKTMAAVFSWVLAFGEPLLTNMSSENSVAVITALPATAAVGQSIGVLTRKKK